MPVPSAAAHRASTVWMAGDAIAGIVAHARAEAPLECCGLLLGRASDIVVAMTAHNASPTPRRRYLVDPADHFRAIRVARARGLAVIGAYHSHPAGSAMPSETDLAEADDAGWLHVIVGLADGAAPRLGVFRIVAGNFHESRLVPKA